MIRVPIILICQLLLSFWSFSVAQVAKVSITAPEEVKAGDEFLSTVTIHKGSLDGISRFHQVLPYGLTATRVSTANADFTFENQRVRLIWLRMPSEPVITAEYLINVDERLKGSFSLDGEFSFIKVEKPESIKAGLSQNIRIIPNLQLSDDQLIDIKDFEEYFLAGKVHESTLGLLEVFRRPPVQISPHEIMVELFIDRGSVKQIARIEEYIPAGFRAAELDSRDGVFSFEDQTLKINWLDLPVEQVFSVKYRLFPERGKSIADLNLSGSYSQLYGNEVKTFQIAERIPDPWMLDKTPGSRASETLSILPEDAIETMAEKKVWPRNRFDQPLVPTGQSFWILQAEEGKYYRIQLAAGRRAVNINSYFNRLPYMTHVRVEFHEGWFKYSVGSFTDYAEAKDFLEVILGKTEFEEAFVVAYDNGKRITVQEALSISDEDNPRQSYE